MLRRPFLPLLACAAVLSACTEPSESPIFAPNTGSAAKLAATGREARMEELTRVVALALHDQGLRQRIRNDLRDSRYTTEHKLHFARYLQGESGGILLGKMTKESGKSREEFLALISSLPALEFYMPVPEHRATWRGGDVLVASQLVDGAVPVGYDLKGNPVQLSAMFAPSTPTLALIPVEGNLSTPLPRQYRNHTDNGGETIGTYTMPVDDDGGSGGGSSLPSGLYLTSTNFKDVRETWVRGYPEIYAYTVAPEVRGEPVKVITCAGEKASGYRYFDQNDGSWSGNALLLTQEEILKYGYTDSENNVVISLWEDDIDECIINDNGEWWNHVREMAAASILAALSFESGGIGILVGIPFAVYAADQAWYVISTPDDHLGTVVNGTDLQTKDIGHNGTVTLKRI